jgi:hypothetical protein
MPRKYSAEASAVVQQLLDGWPDAFVAGDATPPSSALESVRNSHHCCCTRDRSVVIVMRIINKPNSVLGYQQQHWRVFDNGTARRVL